MAWWPFRRRIRPPPPKGRPFGTRDGTWVRSLGEQRVADFLSRRGVPYTYEPRVLSFRPDFAVDGGRILIEYWGGAGHTRYDAQMQRKTEAFEAAGYDVVHLLPIHLRDLERVLETELRARGVLD